MRLILHRYIFVELLKTFVLSTAAITLFLSLANALTELRDRGLGPVDSAHLVLYLVPAMLVFAMPVAALLTTTLIYGRLASDNEVTACRASGVATSTLLRPVIVLGLLIGALTFVLHDRVIPWSRYQAEDVGRQNMERIFFHQMRTRRHVSFRDFFMSAKLIEGDMLYGAVLRYSDPGGRSFVAYAPAARVDFTPPSRSGPPVPKAPADEEGPGAAKRKRTPEEIARQCWDASVAYYGDVFVRLYHFYAFDEGQARRTTLARGNYSFNRALTRVRVMEPEEMTLGQLIRRYEQPDDTYLYVQAEEQGAAAEPLRKLAHQTKAKSLAEMHGRYALVVTCVLLVALGAGLGLIFRHGHILTAFFISMGPALFAIFCVLFGVKMVKADPEHMHGLVFVIWAGNIVVLAIDAILVGRMVRQ